MRPIPATRLGDAHGLLHAIETRGRLRTDEFVTEFSLDELFPPGLENALGRLRHFVSYARAAGLVKEDRGVVELTDLGRRYVRAADPAHQFEVSSQQAEWLRRQLREKHMTDSIFHGLAIGLSLLASCPPGTRVSTIDFGRSMAYLGRAGWDNENTLEIQGERHLVLLTDMGMIDGQHRLTATGEQVRGELTLPVHMSLIDIAGQLNPGGPAAVTEDAEREWAQTQPPPVEQPPPAPEPVEEAEEDGNGYHTVGGAGWPAVADEPPRPPIVPRAATPAEPIDAPVRPDPASPAVAPGDRLAGPAGEPAITSGDPLAGGQHTPAAGAAAAAPPVEASTPVAAAPPAGPVEASAASGPPAVAPHGASPRAVPLEPYAGPPAGAPPGVSPPPMPVEPAVAPLGVSPPAVPVQPPAGAPPGASPPAMPVEASAGPPAVAPPGAWPPAVPVEASAGPPAVAPPGASPPAEGGPAAPAALVPAPPSRFSSARDFGEPAGSPSAPAAGGWVASVEPSGAGPAFVEAGAIRAAGEAAGLRLAMGVYANVAAALAAGKHLLLTGAPGAGKTALALAVARAAAQAGRAQGATVMTAEDDWAPRELLIEAATRGRWVILDELDRARPDEAFGSLSSFLAGIPVVLAGGEEVSPAEGWRIVATWSGRPPRASAAVLRRFAVVDVAGPPADELRVALREAAAGDQAAARAAEQLLVLAELAPLGAGVFLDVARHAAARQAAAPTDDATLVREAYVAYVAPLLGELDEDGERRVRDVLGGA